MGQAEDVPLVGDEDVARAEQDAVEAAALVEALEERVREGDESITPEQIAGQRELGRFARLRLEATRRKAERAREAQRQRDLAELADTIRTRHDDGERLVRLAQAAGRAMEAFVAACEERESWVYQIRERMHALGVPVSLGGVGHRDHAGLGWEEHGAQRIIAGDISVGPIQPFHHVANILGAINIRHRSQLNHPSGVLQFRPYGADDPYGALRTEASR